MNLNNGICLQYIRVSATKDSEENILPIAYTNNKYFAVANCNSSGGTYSTNVYDKAVTGVWINWTKRTDMIFTMGY